MRPKIAALTMALAMTIGSGTAFASDDTEGICRGPEIASCQTEGKAPLYEMEGLSMIITNGHSDVSFEATAKSKADGDIKDARKAKKAARKAAIKVLTKNACEEVGAKRCSITEIRSENYDGEWYSVSAEVKAYFD